MPKKIKQKFFKAANGTQQGIDQKIISTNHKNLFVGGFVVGPTATDFNGDIQTISSNNTQQLLVVGLNHCGQQKFYKTAGSDDNNSQTQSLSANSKIVFSTGFIASNSSDFEDNDLNNSSRDIFVAGLDNCGNQKFFKIAGDDGDASDNDEGLEIVSNEKAAFLTGTLETSDNPRDFEGQPVTSYGTDDIFVASVDNCGKQKFFKTAGSVNSDNGSGIALNKKRVFVTGSINGPTATDFSGQPVNNLQGSLDVFVAGLDHCGNQKFFKVAGSVNNDFGVAITANEKMAFAAGGILGLTATDFEGNIINNVNGNVTNIFVAGLNNCGLQKFFKVAGSNSDDSVFDSTNDKKGIYLTGRLGGTSATGFDGKSIPNINNNNEIFVTGLDLCGNQKFFKTAGGTGFDLGFTISSNGSHLFVAGQLNNSGTATDFKGNVIPLKGDGNEIFVAVLDNKNGCQKAFLTAGGTGSDSGIGLTIRDDMIFVSGRLEGECDFNGKTIDKPDGNTIFVARLDDLTPKKIKPFRTKNPYF